MARPEKHRATWSYFWNLAWGELAPGLHNPGVLSCALSVFWLEEKGVFHLTWDSPVTPLCCWGLKVKFSELPVWPSFLSSRFFWNRN